jgi:hypothetical protein
MKFNQNLFSHELLTCEWTYRETGNTTQCYSGGGREVHNLKFMIFTECFMQGHKCSSMYCQNFDFENNNRQYK